MKKFIGKVIKKAEIYIIEYDIEVEAENIEEAEQKNT